MNILVTGAMGQLGTCIMKSREPKKGIFFYTDINGNPKENGIEKLDITNKDQVDAFIENHNIDVVINCAAYTNVEGAESHEVTAHLINAEAPRILAEAIKKRNGWLIQISTDYVFGEEQYDTPCTEEMKGTPLGVYGITKKRGEQLIIESGCKYLIIRTSWLYCEYGHNFCKTILDKLTTSDAPLKVVNDQRGTPTYARSLANAILKIVNKYLPNEDSEKYVGIYNYSNEGECTWYEFACAIRAKKSETESKLAEILPCSSSEYPSKVKRPSYSVLSKKKIKDTFDLHIQNWVLDLDLCIDLMDVHSIMETLHTIFTKKEQDEFDKNSMGSGKQSNRLDEPIYLK